MKNKILLISERIETVWFQKVTKILGELGDFLVTTQENYLEELQKQAYDLVIIDASSVENELDGINRVKERQRKAKIVVVTPTPTWRRAKEAINSGATDYISKTLSDKELKTEFTDIISRTSSD